MNADVFSQDYNPDEDGYITVTTEKGVNDIAANVFPGENVTRFKEIVDLNPDEYGEDYFGKAELKLDQKPKRIKIPFEREILKFARPLFDKTSTKISGAKDLLVKLDSIPALRGFSREAIESLTTATSDLYSPSLLSDTAGIYEDQELPRLIPWLLSGKQ
ncbi:MAG: hypothetical protein AN483_12655 [Aphanizomenon flos-aquae MDT14a]|jgi:hypothetical protein|nr:MAG: hypothetical protein AN483_12655 [Aphanizomenon flos-aquae MDT14a]